MLCIWRNINTGFIETHVPVRITRNVIGRSIRLPIRSTEQYRKSVFYMGSKLWNDLNVDVRNLLDFQDFKKEIAMILV